MAAILKSDGSAVVASEFLDALISGDNNLYIAVGRNDEEWHNESLPPTPLDTLQDEEDFRSRIIGIKKINGRDCSLMVPKIVWEAGKTFKPLDKTIPMGKRNTDWFCLTSRNRVFECLEAGLGATDAAAEPDYMDSEVATPDGYKWRYLYTITTQMVNSGLLLNTWMPVAYNTDGVYPGGTLSSDQNSFGDNNANFRLGAFRLMCVANLEDEGTAIPYTVTYRQVGLLWNPRDAEGERLTGIRYGKDEFDVNSGQLMYLENKRPVMREPEQSETLKVIISF